MFKSKKLSPEELQQIKEKQLKKIKKNNYFTIEEISVLYDLFESYANQRTMELNVIDLLTNIKLMKLDQENQIFYKIIEQTCAQFRDNNYIQFEQFIDEFTNQIDRVNNSDDLEFLFQLFSKSEKDYLDYNDIAITAKELNINLSDSDIDQLFLLFSNEDKKIITKEQFYKVYGMKEE